MFLLIIALIAFGIVHLVPAIPRTKAAIQARVGNAYGPVYGLLMLALTAAVLAAHRYAPVALLYTPPGWGSIANIILTLITSLLLAVAAFRGSLRNRIKYPVALAVLLAAGGHLLANGNTRDVLLFVGLAGLGGLFVFLHSRLVEWSPGEVRKGHNLLSIIFGVALFGVLVQAHSLFAGVPVFNIEQYKP